MPMSELPTTFYAVGATTPTLTAHPRSFFGGWSALTEELASYYGEPAGSFDTRECLWRGDDEYAEVVTLDGRIVGAVNRPISAADVAAIERRGSMEKRAFLNRIRSLFNIDGYLLPELTKDQQLQFLRDPVRFFLNADEAQSDAIMREVESRQNFEAAIPRRDALPPVIVERRAQLDLANEPMGDAELKVLEKPRAAKAPRAKKAKPRVEGQGHLLLPIAGKRAAEEKQPAQPQASGRKAG
jgi:hypothetical protein